MVTFTEEILNGKLHFCAVLPFCNIEINENISTKWIMSNPKACVHSLRIQNVVKFFYYLFFLFFSFCVIHI